MGRFKAGDRVKILAGHPYHGVGTEGVYIDRANRGYRGKHNVRVTYEDGDTSELAFKGRELTLVEAAPAAQEPAESWVPKVGDRVRVNNSNEPCDGQIGKVAVARREGTNLDVVFDVWRGGHDGDANDDSSNHWYLNNEDVEPLPVAEQPAGLVVEVGKFYRTRDGRKVGPATTWDSYSAAYPLCRFVMGGVLYQPNGVFAGGGAPEHDLVAEWVDERAAAVAAAVPEATTDEVAVKVDMKLEAGATYIGASGAQHVVEANEGNESWPFKTANVPHETSRFWKADGTAYNDDHWNKRAAVGDPLVSRLEPAAPPAKFKVGDRVRILRDSRNYFGNTIGAHKAGAIVTIRGEMTNLGKTDGWVGYKTNTSYWVRSDDIEPAPAPTGAAGPSFIVARLTPAGLPRPNARPRVHLTLDAANQEAQRLADRLGDEFAVYQRVSVRDVDAGPVPKGWRRPKLDTGRAKAWLDRGTPMDLNYAFDWSSTKQRAGFWAGQHYTPTPLGRAILRKWIAEAEQPTVAA